MRDGNDCSDPSTSRRNCLGDIVQADKRGAEGGRFQQLQGALTGPDFIAGLLDGLARRDREGRYKVHTQEDRRRDQKLVESHFNNALAQPAAASSQT